MFKEVRLHKRKEMGNKRLGGLLPWQTIHSSSKEQEKSIAEIGEWKSEDGSVERRERERDDLQACIVVLYIRYCTITSCLSGGEIRGDCCSPRAQNLSAGFL